MRVKLSRTRDWTLLPPTCKIIVLLGSDAVRRVRRGLRLVTGKAEKANKQVTMRTSPCPPRELQCELL